MCDGPGVNLRDPTSQLISHHATPNDAVLGPSVVHFAEMGVTQHAHDPLCQVSASGGSGTVFSLESCLVLQGCFINIDYDQQPLLLAANFG